jgi:hypothetical protein
LSILTLQTNSPTGIALGLILVQMSSYYPFPNAVPISPREK